MEKSSEQRIEVGEEVPWDYLGESSEGGGAEKDHMEFKDRQGANVTEWRKE
jgi:hypothetical protein